MKKLGHYYQRAREFHSKYEKFLLPAFLVVGFLFDYITFAAIQIDISFAFLGGYWLASGFCIIFISFYDSGKISEKLRYARVAAFLLVQFFFGNMLSGILVFYWFSAAFSISWPFIATIIFLMLFNDVFREYFSRLQVQLVLYFFITFALLTVMLPFVFNSMSSWFFVLAAAASMTIFSAYVVGLSFIRPFTRWQKAVVFSSMAIIVVVMSTLYFTNIIPPIPLAIRDAGIYHTLKTSGNSYIVTAEYETLWQKLIPGQTLHVTPGERMYLYTAIFAPAKLDTTIVHEWQYYDATQKRWVMMAELPFEILGGRSQGYKAYSYMSNLAAGHWRVYVKNLRGQVLGVLSFNVEHVTQPVVMETITK